MPSLKESCSILGVSKTATQEKIRSAFRRKALQTHPDKGGSRELFEKVHQAYEFLHQEFAASSAVKKTMKPKTVSQATSKLAEATSKARTRAAGHARAQADMRDCHRAKADAIFEARQQAEAAQLQAQTAMRDRQRAQADAAYAARQRAEATAAMAKMQRAAQAKTTESRATSGNLSMRRAPEAMPNQSAPRSAPAPSVSAVRESAISRRLHDCGNLFNSINMAWAKDSKYLKLYVQNV
eukprot:TRINITY_DN22535_c0_g1_i1.p1 TRINITY_DN22535_c0_g1~~TRINITY_DN22535_c0_g1_i1.p1  ORF type:complete len:239 (-),score=55.06 TRINITY_DN22535_c0_g1_i1:190-906(-)